MCVRSLSIPRLVSVLAGLAVLAWVVPLRAEARLLSELGHPDLVVSNLIINGGQPVYWGELLVVQWTLVNVGTAPVTNDYFYDHVDAVPTNGSGAPLVSKTVAYDATQATNGPIGPGEIRLRQFTLTLNDSLATREYAFSVTTDYTRRVSEANADGTAESNNNSEVQVRSLGPRLHPDLIVTNVNMPAEVFTAEAIPISWVIQNIGTAPAEGTWVDRLRMRGGGSPWIVNVADFTTAGPLAAGAAVTNTGSITLEGHQTPGTYSVWLETDVLQQVAEYDQEENNTGMVPVPLQVRRGVIPYPDLVVTDMVVPSEAFTEQAIPITWTVYNAGTLPVTNHWADMVWLSTDATSGADRGLGTFEFDGSLLPGASVTRTHTVVIERSGTTERDYWFVLATDAKGQVNEEEHETNNTFVAASPTAVRFAPKPNLKVLSVAGPSTAYAGLETVVEWAVTNAGTAGTGPRHWDDWIWLSANTTVDANDHRLSIVRNASYLNPGEAYQNSQTVLLPQGLQGRYYLLVKADRADEIDEGGLESDNTKASGPVQLTIPDAPDLVLTSLQAPDRSFEGQIVSVTYAVANLGDVPTPINSWGDGVYFSRDTILNYLDRLLKSDMIHGALNVGESYTNTIQARLPKGVYGTNYLAVQVDMFSQINEQAFEGNNFNLVPIEILPLPPSDLEVVGVTAPAEAIGGTTFQLNYTVANRGAGRTPVSGWKDRLILASEPTVPITHNDDVAVWTHTGALEPGAEYTDTVTVTAPYGLDGLYYAIVQADFADQLCELDRTNNLGAMAVPMRLRAVPSDLALAQFDVPAEVAADGLLELSWRVANLGPGETIAHEWVDRIILSRDSYEGNEDDLILDEVTHRGVLPVGADYTVANYLVPMPYEAGPGQYYLWLEVNASYSVFDRPRTNNFNPDFLLTVTGQPADLQVDEVTGPASALVGDAIEIAWTVRNHGGGPARESRWEDAFYLSPTNILDATARPLGRQSHVNPLPAGSTYTHSALADLTGIPAGIYYLLAQADALDEADEPGGEDNNVVALPPQIELLSASPPDLAVVEIDAPTDATCAQGCAIRYTVKNLGEARARAGWSDSIFLSIDQILDRSDDYCLGSVSPGFDLPGGATYTLTNTIVIPPGFAGPWYVFVLADAGRQIETDPALANNAGYDRTSMLIRAHPPVDLVAGVLSIPTNVLAGQVVWLTYQVSNLQSQPAEGVWWDALYLSRDSTWDLGDELLGRVQHQGDLVSGASYTNSLSVTLPSVLPGPYYVIVRTDIRNHIPETDEGNNLAVSLGEARLDVRELSLGSPATGFFGAQESACYQLEVEGGRTLELVLDSEASVGFNEVYVRYGAPPDRIQFDFMHPQPNEPDQRLVIPRTSAGTYYVLIFANSAPRTRPAYTLTARYLEFGLTRVEPNRGGNRGEITLQLEGAAFDARTQVELVLGAQTLPARWIRREHAARILATFDLSGVPAGKWAVHAHSEERMVTLDAASGTLTPFVQVYGDHTLPEGFEVVEGGQPLCRARLLTPEWERMTLPFLFYVEVANEGLNDLPVPVHVVSTLSGTPISTSPTGRWGTSQYILPLGQYRSEVLIPGEKVRIPLYGLDAAGTGAQFGLRRLSSIEGAIPWAEMETYYHDARDPNWDLTWAIFRGYVGTTWADLETALSTMGIELAPNLEAQFVAGGRLIPELLARASAAQPLLRRSGRSALAQGAPTGTGSCCSTPGVTAALARAADAVGLHSNPVSPCQVSLSDAILAVYETYCWDVCIPGLFTIVGVDAGMIWSDYLSSTAQTPTGTQNFEKDDYVAAGFAASEDTDRHLDFIKKTLKKPIAQLLEDEGCEFEGGDYDLKDLIEESNAAYRRVFHPDAALTFYDPLTIPGNLAGGVSGPGDKREVTEGNVNIEVMRDACDKIVYLRCRLTTTMTVDDVVDFCPGDLSGGLEMACTYPMAYLEANNWAYDVPIHVEFEPWMHTFTVDDIPEECKSDCDEVPPDPCIAPCANCMSLYEPDGDCCEGDPSCDKSPRIRPVSPIDPNDICGPAGAGPEQWVGVTQPLDYTIHFENDPLLASAPAQQVLVTQQLDADLDWRSFRLGAIRIGDTDVAVPSNRAYYQSRLDLRDHCGLMVDVLAGVDVVSGRVFWQFTAVDPLTGDLPLDPMAGFLPPNLTSPEGEGSVAYSILPKPSAPSGARIDAEAEIVFDLNAPLATAPIFNTLDTAPPTSRVQALVSTSDDALRLLTWTGEDDADGSGLQSFEVSVSVDGRSPSMLLSRTELRSTLVTMAPGHAYTFFTRAIDLAGNLEPAAEQPDLATVLADPVPQLWPIADLATDEDIPLQAVPITVQETQGGLDQLTFHVASSDRALLPVASIVVSGQGNQRQLDLTPAPNQFGQATVILVVSNAQYSATQQFTVTVRPVNDPPQAVLDELVRLPDTHLRIPAARLLDNDADLEGDTLQVVSVARRSANGVPVSLVGGWLEYRAPAGDNRDDQFTYVVADDAGATSQGTASVLVERLENGLSRHRLHAQVLPDGSVAIRFTGVPGKVYSVQSTDSLGLPDWRVVVTQATDEAGAFVYVATPASNSATGFFRTVTDP